jgi:transmembrane protein TMEM260 (protein O-mannosyltransferase)
MNGASAAAAHSYRSSRRPLVLALVVFIASLVVYALTLAPTVTLVDSGELILAARSLGVAHPPGFPLYVLLAHLATLVPIGNIAVRVNFTSAIFASLAASALTLAVVEAMATTGLAAQSTKTRRRSRSKKRAGAPSQTRVENAHSHPLISIIPLLVAGLLLAFSRTLWAYATIAEVYTLNTFLIAGILFLMFRWRRVIETGRRLNETWRQDDAGTRREDERGRRGDAARRREGDQSPGRPVAPSPRDGLLYAAALVFGVALGVHHVTVGLMLPAFAALVLATEGIGFFISKRLLYAALFGFAGLFAVYAYLPIAASRAPIMNWGDPRTFERLWWHITGRQYQVFLSYSLQTAVKQFGDFIKLAAREFGPWWLPVAPALALAGMVALFKSNRAVFWFLALVIIADLSYSLGYEIAEDKDAYYLPVFIAMAIAAGFGAKWLINKVISSGLSTGAAPSLTAALVLLVPIVALAANLPYNNRTRYYIAHDYTENILSTIEPGGMLLTRDWQVYSPMLYVREIEHRRDDAVVIDINQLRRSWYYDYLARAYPATIEQSRDKVDPFLEDLRHWEQDPDLYQRDLTLNHRITSRFFEMIEAFVTNHIRSAPVYVTLDVAANREGPDSELTETLVRSYDRVPQGLVFQLVAKGEYHQPADPQLSMRGLADGTLKFEDDDVVKLKVLPVYVTMFYNRGYYLAVNGHHKQAINSFKEALDLDPGFTPAQKALNESLSAFRKANASKTQ